MRRIRTLGLLLACAAAGASAAPDRPGPDAAREELGRLRGSWACSGVERGGKEDRSGTARAGAGYMTLTIRGDALRIETVILGEKASRSGTIRVEPTAEPKRIDLTFGPGDEEAGLTVRGIYALDGDRLRIRWPAEDPGRRPTTLRTAEGDGSEVELFERRR